MIELTSVEPKAAVSWRPDPAGVRHLYIHIPFCHRRCSYCDFNTYANMEDRIEAYVDALCGELASFGWQRSEARDQGTKNQPPASSLQPRIARLRPTIFLGGGTPSMLPLPLMERVLRAADAVVPLQEAEVTVEANPGTVLGSDYLRGLRGLGVNRLSMGVQSLHDPTLRMLGRIHTAAEARTSYDDARRAGFDNINLDFIFGLPGQELAQWDATLREITTWDVDHFSLYSLILEEKTPLYAQVMGGRLQVPDDDATADMYEHAMEQFGAAGYVQYEISNWAKRQGSGVGGQGSEVDSETLVPSPQPPIPAFACHHNIAYWLNADYLAAGAGAHGHVFPRRYSDVLGIDEYVRRIRAGASPIAEIIDLTGDDLRAETMFMGLRMNAGVSFAHFADRCGIEMDAVFGDVLADLLGLGLLERDDVGVRLTARGRMLGNQVFERFV